MTGKRDYGKPESLAFVSRLRDEIVPGAGFPAGVSVYAGGGPPRTRTLDLIYSWFPWLLGTVIVATFVLLMQRSPRSCSR